MFVSVKFHQRDTRTYTYACDIPASVGDMVLVATKDGQKVVEVVSVDLPEPKFECKPIVGFAPKAEEQQGGEQ